MISQMLKKQGVIQGSSSPWASPVVLVAKNDDTNHFCVDSTDGHVSPALYR